MLALSRDRRAAGAAQTAMHRGPGWPVLPAPKPSAVSPGAPVLIVVRNALAEPVSVRAQAWTPLAAVFLDTHLADVEPGGATAFVCCAAADLRVDLPFASGAPRAWPRRLVLVGAELRLHPGAGLEQKQTQLPAGWPFAHCLTVVLQAVVNEPGTPSLSLADLVAQHPGFQSLRGAVEQAGELLPEQCTLLVPTPLPPSLRELSPEALLRRLATATAVFCGPRTRGAGVTLDGSLLTIATDGSQAKFSIAAGDDELPGLDFRGDAAPLRCSDRYRLLYLVAPV